jgi:nucleotide-binding universal stress UspA family protein
MYRRILVTLDGSLLAEQVLPHVKAVLEGLQDVHVYLLSVAQLVDYSAASAMAYPMSMLPDRAVDEDAERRRIETELRDYLRGIEHQLAREGVTVSSEVHFGRPAEEIISFATDMQVELIAMSTHGRSGLARWAYGSVADRVLHAARCPVLLVRVK